MNGSHDKFSDTFPQLDVFCHRVILFITIPAAFSLPRYLCAAAKSSMPEKIAPPSFLDTMKGDFLWVITSLLKNSLPTAA